jgi:hypothetical protein
MVILRTATTSGVTYETRSMGRDLAERRSQALRRVPGRNYLAGHPEQRRDLHGDRQPKIEKQNAQVHLA